MAQPSVLPFPITPPDRFGTIGGASGGTPPALAGAGTMAMAMTTMTTTTTAAAEAAASQPSSKQQQPSSDVITTDMARILIRFADDPLGCWSSSSSSGSSAAAAGAGAGAGADDTGPTSSSVYESYADTPVRRLRRYASSHRRLMSELGRMASTIPVGVSVGRSGTAGYRPNGTGGAADDDPPDPRRDARFVLWAAGLLGDAGRAEVGADGDGDDDGVEKKKEGGCASVLGRVARAVSDVVRAANANNGAGGARHRQQHRTILSILVPPSGGASSPSSPSDAADLLLPMETLLRAPSLLDGLCRRPPRCRDRRTGDGKRRRRRGNFGGHDDDDGDGNEGRYCSASSLVLLGYVLAHYHATSSSFSSSSSSSSSASSPAVTDWEHIQSSTLKSALSMGGMAYRLRSVRAGAAAYGIDSMIKSSELAEEAAETLEAIEDGGGGGGGADDDDDDNGYRADGHGVDGEDEDEEDGGDGGGYEYGDVVFDGGSGVGRSSGFGGGIGGGDGDDDVLRWVSLCDGTGHTDVRIAGLGPRALVELLLGDSGVIPTLHEISGLSHRRELVAELAAAMLTYNFFHCPENDVGAGGGGGGFDPNGNGPTNDNGSGDGGGGVRAILDLIRRGNAESAETYLRFLESSPAKNDDDNGREEEEEQEQGDDDDDDDDDGRGDHHHRHLRLAGSKRKRATGEIAGRRRPAAATPSARPILTEVEAHLCRSDATTAAQICQRLERCSGAGTDVKREGWYLVLDYLYQNGMVFDSDDDEGGCHDGGGVGSPCGSRQFHLLQVGTVGLCTVKEFMRDVVVGAVDEAERAGREAISASSSSSSSYRDAAEAARYAREAEDWARRTQLRVRRTMLKFLLCRRNDPSVALAVADEVSLLGGGSGGGGSAYRPYLAGAAGGPGGRDAQVLRTIEQILSARPERLELLPPLPGLTFYPPLRLGTAAGAPIALEDGGRDAADLSAAEAGADATVPAAEQGGESARGKQPIDEGAGGDSHETSAIVLLDDDEEEEEKVEEEGEAHEVIEGSCTETHGVGEADEAAVEGHGEAVESDSTADQDDIVEILESSSSEDEVVEEESVDHGEEEVHDVEQDEGADDQHADDIDKASFEGESVEEVQPVVANQGNEDAAMSDDMDEADEATAEYDDEEERSAREALHDSDSDVEEVTVEAETHQADNAGVSTGPTVRVVDAEPESVLVQAAMSSQRQHAAGRRTSDFSSGAERRGEEDYDDTTCAVAGTDADLSEYYTETSQGTHDSGAEFETEPRVDPHPPRNQEEEAQPGSLLIAAAMSSQRDGNESSSGGSSGDESGRTGDDYYDDTTAAVVGTAEFLDECFTDVGSQASQASQRGDDSVGDDAAASEDMGGASQEGMTSAEVSLLEGDEEADQGAGEETILQGEEEPPSSQGAAPAEGSRVRDREEEKSESVAVAVGPHEVEEERSEASIVDDAASTTNTSMVVHPTDSPKGSIILETSETEAEEAQNVGGETPMPKQSAPSVEEQRQPEEREERIATTNEGNNVGEGAPESDEVPDSDDVDNQVLLSPEQSRVVESMVNSIRDQVFLEVQKGDEKVEQREEAEVGELPVGAPDEEEEKEEESLTFQGIEELSYGELQHACKDRDLPAVGKAEDLRERLADYLQGKKAEDDTNAAALQKSARKANEGPVQSEEKAAPPSDADVVESIAVASAAAGAVLKAPLVIAKAVVGLISPKPLKKSDQDMVESDQAIEEGKAEAEAKAQGKEVEGQSDDIDFVDQLSFHELRHECKIRNLRATGNTQDLKDRLLKSIYKEKADDEVGIAAETAEKTNEAPTDSAEMQMEDMDGVQEDDNGEMQMGKESPESAEAKEELTIEKCNVAAVSDEAVAEPSAAATGSGFFNSMKALFSPKSANKKDPEIIVIEDDEEETTGNVEVKQEENGEEEEDQRGIEERQHSGPREGDSLTPEYINGLSYRQLQAQCSNHFLPAKGKKEDLKERLLEFVQNEKSNGDGDIKALADSNDVNHAMSTANVLIKEEVEPEGRETKDSTSVDEVAAAAAADSHSAVAGAPTAKPRGGVMSGITAFLKEISPKVANKKNPEEVIKIDSSEEENLVEAESKQEKGGTVGVEGGAVREEQLQEEDGYDGDAFGGLSARDIDELSYREMQQELKARNLPATGKKDALRERLLNSIQEQNEDIPSSVIKMAPSPMSSIASTPDRSVSSKASRGRVRSTPAVGGQKKLMPVKEEAEDDGASDADEDLGVGTRAKLSNVQVGRAPSVTSSRKSSRARKPNEKYADGDDGSESGVDGGASHASSVTARRRGHKTTKKGSSNASLSSRQGVRRRKEDEEEGDTEEGTRPSPPKRRKLKPAASSPSSAASTRTTRSRLTRGSAASGRSTRASTRARASRHAR